MPVNSIHLAANVCEIEQARDCGQWWIVAAVIRVAHGQHYRCVRGNGNGGSNGHSDGVVIIRADSRTDTDGAGDYSRLLLLLPFLWLLLRLLLFW